MIQRDFPKASIIIANWNRKEHLGDCLSSLSTQTYPNYEVIVVDNGSTDDSVKYVQENFNKVKIIELNKNIGYSAAINLGIKQSNSKYIVSLNNDTKVEPNWLEELVKIAESDERIGSCQPKILSLADPTVIDAAGLSINKERDAIPVGYRVRDEGQYNKIREVLGACSAAVLYRRQALTQIGGFDSDFFAYFEDVDVALRLRLAGWKCMYVPTAIVYHIGSATGIEKSPLQTYLLTRNQYYYKIKNFPASTLLKFLIKRPADILSKILVYIKSREFQLIMPFLKGNLDALKNSAKMYMKRKKNLCVPRIQKEIRTAYFLLFSTE